MENRHRSKLKDQVCHFLKTKGPGAQEKALTIAKGIGLTTASKVNPTLYDLEKSGQLNRTQNTPPLWSLKESQGLTAESLSHDSLPAGSQMKTEIRTGNMDKNSLEEQVCLYLKKKGPAAKEVALIIAKGVGLKTAKEINPTLYKLVKSGQLARTEDTPYYWSLKGVAGESLSHDSALDDLALMTQEVLKLDGQDRLQSRDNNMEGSENGTDTRSLGEFSDVEKLGCGGYGCVFKAKHNIDGKHYAVKIVKYTGVEEKHEVEVLSKLEHPNIVRYHTSWIGPGYSHRQTDNNSTNQKLGTSFEITFERGQCSGPSFVSETPYGDEEDQEDQSGLSGSDTSMSAQQSIATASRCLYMKMELCDGGSLREWFRSKGKSRNKEDALAAFRQVVQGVEYVHSKGLIHRDLKPENILFGANDTVKIGDFGLVTLITDENGAPITRTKGRGTESYRSPEQENNSNYNEKTDIFPLGLILFELLWKMETETERAKIWSKVRVRKLPPEFFTEFSQEHQLICMLLSEGPQERPSATEIGERLKPPV